jgi:hypothetical protein
MTSDDFEQRLQRQPLREVPGEWRSDILSNAHQALYEKSQASFWSRAWQHILKPNTKAAILLWPSSKAWASLAVVWVLLLIVNFSTNEKSRFVSPGSLKPTKETFMAWREQERLVIEILEPHETPVADKPKPVVPRPRSERQNEFRII